MKELPKNNPFKTPEGYFENFAESLDDALRLEKLNISKQTGHTVPEGYFEELTQQVLSKVEPAASKVVSLNNRFYYAAASIAAATIITLITLGISKKQGQNNSMNNDIALEVIEKYMLEDETMLFDFDITNELLLTEDLQLNIESLATQDIEIFLETELDNLNFEDYAID